MVSGKPQQETADDGQATWNLISRNGQDVVSGIYMFSVESQSRHVEGQVRHHPLRRERRRSLEAPPHQRRNQREASVDCVGNARHRRGARTIGPDLREGRDVRRPVPQDRRSARARRAWAARSSPWPTTRAPCTGTRRASRASTRTRRRSRSTTPSGRPTCHVDQATLVFHIHKLPGRGRVQCAFAHDRERRWCATRSSPDGTGETFDAGYHDVRPDLRALVHGQVQRRRRA